MPALDIFSGSAFSMVALTDAINKMPFVPGRIGQLGLFREQGVSTTAVMIEEREGSLTLVETTSRGAPAVQHVANKRKARSLTVPHVALEDTILADEVQNVRAFGSENMLEGVQAVVNQRLTEMATKMDATLEHLRVGAIKGQILDADGIAVIYDLFTEFGVTAYAEIDFDLDNASPAAGAVKKECHDVRRKIEDELGAGPYDHIHAICGRRLLRRPDHPSRGHDGLRPLPGRRLPAPGPGARLVRVLGHRLRGVPGPGRHGRLHGCEQGLLFPGRRAGVVPAVQRTRRFRRDRQHHRPAALRQAGGGPAVRPLGHAARAVQPVADLHPAAGADQGQAHLMTVFEGAVDATFAAFGIDAVYTPAGGDPVPVRVIARRPDTIVDFGETRIHAETATFELRASEVANPRPGDQLTVGGETFVVQGEPERRDPDRLVWSVDARPL